MQHWHKGQRQNNIMNAKDILCKCFIGNTDAKKSSKRQAIQWSIIFTHIYWHETKFSMIHLFCLRKKMCNVKERKKECVRYLQPYGILHMYLNINYLRSYVMTQANFQTKGQVNYAHWIMNTGNSIHDTLTSLSNNQASHTNVKHIF